MMTIFKIPFTDPVLVFAVVLLVILITPLLFSRFKIPGIVGLILSGVALGPNAFHVLERDASIILFGTVGLLYLMFMAGLELDMNDFKKHKYKSIIFGSFTFIFPFILGFVCARFVLHYTMAASVLLASMFSTHTLIAYPIISKLGISQSRTVVVIIGGTIITDAVVLLLLAVITNVLENEISVLFFGKLFLFISGLMLAVLWGVPRLARWFFRTLESDGHSHYLFVLAIVFLSGFLAHLAGIEPIIGAFLAGLALNQLIPNTSTLMNRIEFIGNTLFIPFFLISVGMMVDLKVLLKGPETLLISVLIIAVSFTGKWLAAYFTQQIFKFTKTERQLIWGMSTGHAAATIAVVVIGYHLKLFDENILNSAILLILVSCLGSSLISERAGRTLALRQENTVPLHEAEERILIPVANLNNVDRLIDLSLFIKTSPPQVPIYPLYVLTSRQQADERIVHYQTQLNNALRDSAIETKHDPIFRVDLNTGTGILRSITELRVTKVIMGWDGQSTNGKTFGPILDRVVRDSTVQLMICRVQYPLNTIRRIVVVLPQNMESEMGFADIIKTITQISKAAGGSLTMYGTEKTNQQIQEILKQLEKPSDVVYEQFQQWSDMFALAKKLERNDFFVTVLARPQTASFHTRMEKVPRVLSDHFQDLSMMVMYPKQS